MVDFIARNYLPGGATPTGLEGRSSLFSSTIKGESIMKLSQPKQITFWLAVISCLIALLGSSGIASWPLRLLILLIAFVLLALGQYPIGF
jgi:threonine/homoserine/homoserine lactone efflux protein